MGGQESSADTGPRPLYGSSSSVVAGVVLRGRREKRRMRLVSGLLVGCGGIGGVGGDGSGSERVSSVGGSGKNCRARIWSYIGRNRTTAT